MADLEKDADSPPPSKVLSLLDLIQQTKARLASESKTTKDPSPP